MLCALGLPCVLPLVFKLIAIASTLMALRIASNLNPELQATCVGLRVVDVHADETGTWKAIHDRLLGLQTYCWNRLFHQLRMSMCSMSFVAGVVYSWLHAMPLDR